jgi:hypothetical protein
LASVGVGVDVLVTVHEKVTTGKRGWHKVVGTGNVARKGCESVPTTKRVGVVVRTLELGKRAMVVMCLALLWILNLQKNFVTKMKLDSEQQSSIGKEDVCFIYLDQ